MRKIILFIMIVFISSCSSHNWFTSDSDAFVEYDRANGRWQMIWTWKLAKGRTKTDTILIHQRPDYSKDVPLPSGADI